MNARNFGFIFVFFFSFFVWKDGGFLLLLYGVTFNSRGHLFNCRSQLATAR